jgi:hypothetical protein
MKTFCEGISLVHRVSGRGVRAAFCLARTLETGIPIDAAFSFLDPGGGGVMADFADPDFQVEIDLVITILVNLHQVSSEAALAVTFATAWIFRGGWFRHGAPAVAASFAFRVVRAAAERNFCRWPASFFRTPPKGRSSIHSHSSSACSRRFRHGRAFSSGRRVELGRTFGRWEFFCRSRQVPQWRGSLSVAIMQVQHHHAEYRGSE